MKKIYNTMFFLTVIEFLSLFSSQLSAQIQTDLKTNPEKVKLQNQVLYIRKEVAGGGTQDLLDANTKRLPGICSFDENKLQQGRAFVFDKISINYKSDAAASKEGLLVYDAAVPKEAHNLDFVLKQNGAEVLRMPLRDIHNIENGTNAADEYTQLDALCLLDDQHPIEMQFIFPNGAVLDDSVHHYFQVRLKGLQTAKKS